MDSKNLPFHAKTAGKFFVVSFERTDMDAVKNVESVIRITCLTIEDIMYYVLAKKLTEQKGQIHIVLEFSSAEIAEKFQKIFWKVLDR